MYAGRSADLGHDVRPAARIVAAVAAHPAEIHQG